MKKSLLVSAFRLAIISVPAILTGCSGETEIKQAANIDTAATVSQSAESGTKTFYQVPAPSEVFTFMKDKKINAKNPSILNKPENISTYTDSRTKALNFGIYAADLLYCSTFDYGAESVKYFAAVKKLGDELGISAAIDEKSMKRIQANVGNNDSLTDISNDIYYKAFETLEGNDQGKTLALVIAGGWLEGLYLLTANADKFSDNNPIVQRVAEQKLALDNLVEYLNKYSSDPGVNQTLGEFNELKGIYAGLGEKSMGASNLKTKNGKRVLGGGSKITITQDQYNALVEKVNSLRNSIIGKTV